MIIMGSCDYLSHGRGTAIARTPINESIIFTLICNHCLITKPLGETFSNFPTSIADLSFHILLFPSILPEAPCCYVVSVKGAAEILDL